MKLGLLSVGAAILLTAFSARAKASTFHFTFSGPGVGGTINLTYGTATDATYPQAYEITGISGTFNDSNALIANAPILGLVPLNRVLPEMGNGKAPNDFSAFAVANGLGPEANGSLHYDNLLWPGGSPQTATDYPFFGGIFDIYGLFFDIGNGQVVNLWSNGVNPNVPGPYYGVAVATHEDALDYTGGVAIAQTPEPSSFVLLGTGVAAVISRRRIFRRA